MTKKTARNVAEKLIEAHLVSGEMTPGAEIGLRVDQGLLQDALGTLSMLALEAMDIDRVRTDAACQYVDHNLLQTDTKNADDHTFLRTAAARFGLYFSPPGNGISHPVHMERLGKPGALLLGSDSHSCAAGSLGMLGMGAGSIEVAMSLAGMPVYIRMPEILGVKLTGSLPDWVSAKDVILEMLRRHGVTGGLGRVIEYYGPGLEGLGAMDRHVIANMGAELGATTSVFPSDGAALDFLRLVGREGDWTEILADEGATYDVHEEIDLSSLEPLIAKPTSPGNVVPVREIAGEPVYQAYIGSSANPGYRDFAVAAQMVEGRQVAPGVSFDINPSSREMLANLMNEGLLAHFIQAGARLHQAGCNGCHGMGQSPAAGKNSLRTTPRNFDGRSGVKEDRVFLCSPETAAAAALTGVITDPRDLDMPYPKVTPPKDPIRLDKALIAPVPVEEARTVAIEKGAHTASLPLIDPFPRRRGGADPDQARRRRFDRCDCAGGRADIAVPQQRAEDRRIHPDARRRNLCGPGDGGEGHVGTSHPRRREFRSGIEPGSRGAVPAVSRREDRIGQELRPHLLAEPDQRGRAAADLRRSGRLRPVGPGRCPGIGRRA